MIKSIHVSNFRSLRDFRCEIRRGLNVLVGPNGSGKTNIVEFLTFVTNMTQKGLLVAIAQAGGSARVFSREILDIDEPVFAFSIDGTVDWSATYDGLGPERKQRFRWEIEISFSPEKSLVYVKSEVIKLGRIRVPKFFHLLDSDRFILVLKCTRTPSKPQQVSVDVDYERARLSDALGPVRYGPKTPATLKKRLSEMLGEAEPYECMITSRIVPYYGPFRNITKALSLGVCFNINPSVARSPDDVAATPGIKSSGAGLTATLMHYQDRATKGIPFQGKRIRPKPFLRSFSEIMKLTKMIDQRIDRIDLSKDMKNGVINAQLVFKEDGREFVTPFFALSDGTIKWIVAVTAFATGSPFVAFEEPENYLHPAMQKMFVEVARAYFDGSSDQFLFITTHSQTVLDECLPNEIIIAKFENGVTQAGRVLNRSKLSEAIRSSGFGLGYFYAANAFEA